MKCPYCEKEMEKGTVYSTGLSAYQWAFWLQKSYVMQHTVLPNTKKKIGEAGGYVLEPEKNDIYVCRECGKMIADLK